MKYAWIDAHRKGFDLANLYDMLGVSASGYRAPGNAAAHRRVTRTTNLLERLFGEERRRTKIIPHAFGERAVMKLMFAALMRASQTWRGVTMTDFERRQLETLRDELEMEFSTATATPLKPASRSSIYSKNGA